MMTLPGFSSVRVSPVRAMFWQMWRGWRLGLVLGGVYLVAAAATARFLPELLRRSPAGEAFLPNLGTQLALPCAFLAIYLAAAFSLTGADLKERGYWRTMFVLPVRTRTLVFWPMLWGSLTLAAVWLFVALFILRPTGNPVPLVWPMLALAASLALLQVHAWTPIAPAWLSIAAAIPLLFCMAMAVALVGYLGVPEPVATLLFAAVLPLSYLGCLRGVTAARQGDVWEWTLWQRLMLWMTTWRSAGRPFASAARAQLWFECRSFAWLLPLMTGVLMPFFATLVVLEARNDVASVMRPLTLLMFMPALMSMFLGFQFGSASFPFVATRPIASGQLVAAKFRMALVSALLAHVPLLIVLPLLWLSAEFRQAAWAAASQAGALKTGLVLVGVVAAPVALTWKGLAENMWLGLTGREWLGQAIAFSMAGLVGTACLVGIWMALNPPLLERLMSLAPWLVMGLLGLKVLAAALVIWLLVRTKMIRVGVVGMLVVGWMMVTAGLWLLGWWFVPAQVLSAPNVLAGALLLVPFARLAGAPLAIDWNRHR